MLLIILGFVGIILFVCGIAFALRAYRVLPDADQVISISEFESLKKNLTDIKGIEASLKGELNACQQELETVRESLQLTQKQEEDSRKELEHVQFNFSVLKVEQETKIAESQTLIATLRAEEELLKQNSENDKNKIQELKDDINLISEKLVDQAQGALEFIEHLNAEISNIKNKKDTAGDMREIAEADARLVQNEKTAQHELSKAKAQVLALEKICAEYKTKFEAFEQIKEELREAKNKLTSPENENVQIKKI